MSHQMLEVNRPDRNIAFKGIARFAFDQIIGLPFSAVIFYNFNPPFKRGIFDIVHTLLTAPVNLKGEQSGRVGCITGVTNVIIFQDRDGEHVGNIQFTPDREGRLDVFARGQRYTNQSTPAFRVDRLNKSLMVETIVESGKRRKTKRLVHALFLFRPDQKIK